MRLWLLTSIDLAPGRLRASGLQNLQTAIALAEAGHPVLLWCAALGPDPRDFLAEYLDRPLPDTLRLLAAPRRGRPLEKKTPFASPPARLSALLRAGHRPDAVLARSPRALSQLRRSRLLPRACRLVLELQHPEWALLWRDWRRRHPQAPPAEARRVLAQLRQKEIAWTAMADGVLYAAHDHERLLRRYGYAGPAAPLPSSCPPPDTPPDAAAEFDIGCIGSLGPAYGSDLALRALARLPGRRMLMLGGAPDAPEAARLRALAYTLELGDRALFRPHVDFRQVRPLMRRCQVGLVPLSARHGPEIRQWASPLVLFEWMGAGRPVLASDIPSNRQYLEGRDVARLFRADDPEALARALAELLDHPAAAQAQRAKAFDFIRDFDYQHRARRILEFIDQLPAR